MDAQRILTDTLPGFPGYGIDVQRRLSDELVRAYIGEALALLSGRLTPDVISLTPLDELLLRCEFRNQVAFRAYEDAELDPQALEQTAQNDVRLVELAQRAPSINAESAPDFLAEVKRAFDERDHAMQAGDVSSLRR